MMKRMHPAYVLTQLPRFFWLLVLPLMRRLIEWKNIGLAGKLPLLIAVFLIFAAAFLRWQTQRWAIRGNALPVSYTHLDVYKRQVHYLPCLCSYLSCAKL